MPKLDMESVQNLVRAADIEGFIADGDPRHVIRDPKVAEVYMGIETDA